MSFKDTSHLARWRPLCLAMQNRLCNFSRIRHEEHFRDFFFFKFEPVVREEMSLKDIFYLELWQTICSTDWNRSCNFGRRHHTKQFCELILNIDQWFSRRCRLKIFLFWSSGGTFVQQSRTFFRF